MGRATALVLSNALASLSVGLMALSPSNEALTTSLSIVIAIHGAFSGALWPIYATCVGDLFPSSVGTVLGLWTLMMELGASAARPSGGYWPTHSIATSQPCG